MAEWDKNKVEPSDINGGHEFTTKDNLAINELNAIVNNSFYASEKAKRAESLAESAVLGQGTPVTLDGEVLSSWSADFAEAERLKGKNLCYLREKATTQNGVTVTFDSKEQIVTLNGTATSNIDFWANLRTILPTITNDAGKTYTVSQYYVSGSVSSEPVRTNFGSLDGNSKGENIYGNRFPLALLSDVQTNNISRTTINITKDYTYDTLHFYISANAVLDNFKFKIQIEEGDIGSDWKTPYGLIVRTKDISSNILTSQLLANYNFSATKTEELLPLSLYNSVGNKLSMLNNKVVIGEGVSKVKVSYIATVDGTAPHQTCYFYLYKNSTRLTISRVQHHEQYVKGTISWTPMVVSVITGDTLSLRGYTNSTDNHVSGGSETFATHMTVEVVE